MKASNETEISRNNYITAAEAAKEIGCGRSCAAKYILKLNKELEGKGYMTAPGRVPRAYFYERFGLLFTSRGGGAE